MTDPSQWGEPVRMGAYTLAFEPLTGALVQLTHGSRNWASPDHPVARFMYRSHAYSEAVDYARAYNYNHGGPHPYSVPFSWPRPGMNSTTTVARAWHAPMVSMWKRVDSVLVELAVPETLRDDLGYGAPESVWVNISASSASSTMLSVDLAWTGKQPSRLLESIWLEFRPLLPASSTLSVVKMGSEIDASEVVEQVSYRFHALTGVL